MRLSSLKRPFVCLVVSEPTAGKVIGLVDRYERKVDAFEVNLTVLEEKSLRDIFSSTTRPCIATNRRAGFMRFYGYENLQSVGEEERSRRLSAAAEAGASAVDCELDIFDEKRQTKKPPYLGREEEAYWSNPKSEPAELSRTRSVVDRQTEFATRLKGAGAEVLFSCHTQTVITKDQGAAIISAMEDRGADLGKIVSMTPRVDDLSSFVETVIHLKRTSPIPFNVMNVGSESILGRLLSVELGSSWVYCRPDEGKTFGGQPTVAQVRNFFAITGRKT